MKKLIGIAVLAVAGVAMAQDAETNGWRLSLGASYRTFGDVDFLALTLAQPSGNYVNGSYADGGNYDIQHGSQLQPGGWAFDGGLGLWTRNATFDQTSFGGGSEGADDSTGFVLELEKEFKQTESDLTLSMLCGLGFFQSEAGMSANGLATTTLTGMLTSPVDPGAAVPVTPYTVAGSAGFPLSGPVDLGAAATTAATLNFDADLDLYVLSLGVRGAYQVGDFGFVLGAGPTINLADFETEARQTVTNTAGGSAGYTRTDSDSTSDVVFGAFIGVGAEYRYAERWALGIEYRYDTLFSDVETDQAEIELDGHSLQAKLSWSF
ncbi:MAG: outer membrane beta-barrel protein [Lentisphaerae bacterium]|jgi:opacity protein-like surface antigen|nr:outer membrane beta-barrel protein [Lentisphaerota bacterium]